jgi:hypothetical protein
MTGQIGHISRGNSLSEELFFLVKSYKSAIIPTCKYREVSPHEIREGSHLNFNVKFKWAFEKQLSLMKAETKMPPRCLM